MNANPSGYEFWHVRQWLRCHPVMVTPEFGG
jgi:hypothetical protein